MGLEMNNSELIDDEYRKWLTELKSRIRTVQLKAAISVNKELLEFYWGLGFEIIKRQSTTIRGDSLIRQLSIDLAAEFPDMKGFSATNLKYARQWYLFYSQQVTKSQQLVDLLNLPKISKVTLIPWGHNIAIFTKCKNVQEAIYYVEQTIHNNWSRVVLVHQIESDLFNREGKAITNFNLTLPKPQSDLAQQTLKNPYMIDFLTMSKDYNERDLEKALVGHITSFLMELGAGFAFIGRQFPIQVGEREFFIDLLFYHTRLHCFVVVELKTVDFEPEHAGKLNFYIKAIDEQLRKLGDEPTIGILLVKNKDKLVAEYALSDIHKPIGVSAYELTRALPENLKSSLPSIEEIEAELKLKDKDL